MGLIKCSHMYFYTEKFTLIVSDNVLIIIQLERSIFDKVRILDKLYKFNSYDQKINLEWVHNWRIKLSRSLINTMGLIQCDQIYLYEKNSLRSSQMTYQ